MIRLGIVQFGPLLGKVKANIEMVNNLILSSPECDIYILPELANSGYRFKNKEEALKYSEEINDSEFLNALMSIANDRGAHIITGFCERAENKLYNSSVLIGPMGIMGSYRKLHLFMDEKDIFEPGDKGLPVFDTPVGKIGMLVCFDWMFPEAWRVLALKGAQIIAHPSNLVLPYCQSVIPSYALVNKCYIATANRIGKERDLHFTGQSVLASPKGELLLKGSEKQSMVLHETIDLSLTNDKYITPRNHLLDDRRTDVYGDLMMSEDD